ncbi:MAG: CotH kinase family protein [Muribaculaceae bacterium]|nr:CotH kinase family protein [Muribaculaceae bacterium]MDE7141452.1 CotH kinase family protein [Muribaculaceae bacterium]
MRNTSVWLSLFLTLSAIPQAEAFTGGENWDYEAAANGVEPSYTLPILYIDTENGAVIDQKETYINAACWLDASRIEGEESVGSAEAPLTLGIRGRGNATWQLDKKPYKLKFDKKQSLLGMPKNKHYALLTFIGGFSAYFAHPLGMEIGRHIIKGWTPRMTPVEVVLNGQYIGLYVLAETARIDDGRVEIAEQPEGNEDPETITGGYLAEIDNYLDENQLVLWENPTTQLYVTVDTPDPMNAAQEAYLTDQFNAMTAALYNPDKLSRDWEELIDADSYARHFVVEEILNNQDAYNGSCKIYKDFGGLWTFGPLWDVGDSFDIVKEDFTFNTTPYRKTWIPQTYQFPRFVKAVQRVWQEFREIDPAVWSDFLTEWNEKIEQAENQNQLVWKYYRGYTTGVRLPYTQDLLDQHVSWLDGVWGGGPLTRNISVAATGNGTTLLGGHDFPDVDVFEGDNLTVSLTPDQGNVIRSLTVNGEDAMEQVVNGMLNLESISGDIRIDVEYATPSAISEAWNDSPVWHVSGDILSSTIPVEVYTVSGQKIGSGTSIALPGKGIYLLKSGSRTMKIAV